MPFQVSPGVNVTEIDLTTVVPAVSTTEGALAGVFRWGPVDKRILVDSEDALANRFGKPTNNNYETFFTGANFLSYGNKLYVVRAANTTDATGVAGVLSAYANVGTVTTNTNVLIKNDDVFEDGTVAANISTETNVRYIARYPGALGNSLKVSVVDNPTSYFSNTSLASNSQFSTNAQLTSTFVAPGSNQISIKIGTGAGTGASIANTVLWASNVAAKIAVGDLIEVGTKKTGIEYLKVTAVSGVTNTSTVASFTVNTATKFSLSANFGNVAATDTTTVPSGYLKRWWEYALTVKTGAPGKSAYMTSKGNTSASARDEVHLVVVDEDGVFTGSPGQVLEVYEGLSRATDAKNEDGSSNYLQTVINQNSKFIYYGNDRSSGYSSANSKTLAGTSNTLPLTLSFQGGSDGATESSITIAELISAYDFFKSAEEVDVSLVLQGKARGTADDNYTQLGNYLIDNITEYRKDCVAFISPDRADIVLNSNGDQVDTVGDYSSSLRSSSYAVLDSGYKYQYDKYNDVYRYVPLNGDVAGLCARTDDTRDPWFSPAGFNRGLIKNTVKLAYNPGKADRDQLYKGNVNPVVTFPGQGTLLFGDKTHLIKPSAFDRINVRRLFIVLEKAIATAAKFTLFEFNDPFTRSQFRNLVEPFLRDIQGRRGIYDFKVVCDESNNTGEVIDRNEFRGDIYIKPAKSINFIQLNFVAVRSGVEFSEIVGQF